MSDMSAETVQGWIPPGDFSTRLLLARKHARLTVREAAARSGVHYATWSTWERGSRPSNMAGEVNKISQALGVDRAWLMWGELPRLDSNQQPAASGYWTTDLGFRTPWGLGRMAERPVATRPGWHPLFARSSDVLERAAA